MVSVNNIENASSAAILFSQAIRNRDEKELNALVTRIKDGKMVRNTVKEMPREDILPFFEYIDEQMRQKKLRNLHLWLMWVQQTLFLHPDYLATVPDLIERMGQMIGWMEKRSRNMDKLLQLQGKIRFFAQEIPKKQNLTENATPLITFDVDNAIKISFAEERDEATAVEEMETSHSEEAT